MHRKRETHVACSSRCTFLIQDLEEVTPDDLRKDTATGDRTHVSDAVKYGIYYNVSRVLGYQ